MPHALIQKIQNLKKKHNAVILVHNYQPAEVQDIADFLGDSLDLSQKAATTPADTIVFCGVHFMAETAAILCPDKTVLLPDIEAGCPMANMVTAEKLKALKEQNPGVPVVCYINTTAEVKAESDICCTSANATAIVNSLSSETVIFVPDKNLGHYTSLQTHKKFILWDGYCHVHAGILAEHIHSAKKSHPHAELLVHPECTPDVVVLSDKVLSTTGMCRYAAQSNKREFIIGTETGIIHRLKKENPHAQFYPASKTAVCPNMKKITLEKVLWSLEDLRYKIVVEHDIAARARKSIEAMLAQSRKKLA